LITAAYLTADFYIQYFLVQSQDEMAKQMYWHHFFGINSIILAYFGGYGLVGITPLMLLVEVSTVFLNYRALYDKSEFGQAIPQGLMILFFMMFTIFRMILMPFGIYHCIKSAVMTDGFNPLYRRVIGWIAIFQFVCLYLLNCYWYRLMIIRLG
jgi:hypothetical protein